MPSPAQIKARKAFVKKYAGKKKGSKTKGSKSKKTVMYHEHPYQKTNKKPIEYNSETKKKAEEKNFAA